MNTSPYINADGRAITLGNAALECRFDLLPTPRLSVLMNKFTGTAFTFDAVETSPWECSLLFASGLWRYDIPEWRFAPGSGDDVLHTDDLGYQNGYHLPIVDVSEWMQVQQLNAFPIGPPGYSAVTYPGYGWYRHTFHLPASLAGQPIEFGLGGFDNQDWLEYRAYVNGESIGSAQSFGRWHDAARFRLTPGEEGYGSLRFGSSNALAVQTHGLDRRTPEMSQPDVERYSVGSPLVDQYVAASPVQTRSSASRFVRYTVHAPSGSWPDVAREPPSDEVLNRSTRPFNTAPQEIAAPFAAGVELQFTDEDGSVGFTVHYWVNADDPVLHKQIRVRNDGPTLRILQEMDLHNLISEHDVSAGGLGWPCSIGSELFCGIQHPASLAQGEGHSLSLRLFPGRELAPGEAYQSKVAIFGAGPAGEASQSFQHYLASHSPRALQPRWISLYDIYGWHDIAGIDNPTPVTEELVQRSLDALSALRERGITFDCYNIDTGWCNPSGDLCDFDAHLFPSGPDPIVQRVKGMGMKFGLWVSPASGPMAFHPDASNPALAPCGTLPGAPSGAPRGLLCMASEPWRSMFRAALRHHVQANDVRIFKLDGHAFFCTNLEHNHLPGRYSIETLMDAMIDTLQAVRHECPDVMFMYYWGVQSPWWLLYGDTLYERGVLMEGATPSDFPARLLRQSVTTSFDQAAHHAWNSVPLPSHDSLGVWISDTRWGNWMGREGWQDAWLMDIARGSGLTQLWGDLWRLDEQDIDFLARVSAWLHDHGSALDVPRRIGGDPWKGELYGYMYPSASDPEPRQAILFACNPQYRTATLTLRSADLGIALADQELEIPLQPFEVQVLYVDGPGGQVSNLSREWRAGCVGTCLETEPLDLQLVEVQREELRGHDAATRFYLRRAVNGRSQYVDTEEAFRLADLRSDERDRPVVLRQFAAQVSLPPLAAPQGTQVSLDFIARLSREGVFWHHHALFDVLQLEVALDGRTIPSTHMPSRWHEQAGGWSWILFRIPLPASASPAQLTLKVRAYLPASVDVGFEAWLCRETEDL